MKKMLLGAMLIAGTTLGFAKNQVTMVNNYTPELETTTPNNHSNSIHLSKLILGEWCTDIVYATAMIKQPDGSYSEEVISSCETTYPCINAGVRAYIICL